MRAKSIIFLHQYGGPSCHDTFDMKPNAPEQIRGEFKPVASNVPGMPICERLPRMAGVMNKVTLLHGLHHTMKNHNSAGYYSLTGYAPLTDDQRLRIRAICSRLMAQSSIASLRRSMACPRLSLIPMSSAMVP